MQSNIFTHRKLGYYGIIKQKFRLVDLNLVCPPDLQVSFRSMYIKWISQAQFKVFCSGTSKLNITTQLCYRNQISIPSKDAK